MVVPRAAAEPDSERARFTRGEVYAIRILRHDYQMSIGELVRMYRPCSKGVIKQIIRGITHKDVGGPIEEPNRRVRTNQWLGERDSREKERSQCEGSSDTSQGEGSRQQEPSEH